MEADWSKFQTAHPGEPIRVDIELTYADESARVPTGFMVEYKIEDEWITRRFANGGQ